MAIIGIDFGNYNTFPCFISDFDPGTRMGGTVHDLLPSGLQDGIPSVFYYSKKVGVLCGEEAVRTRARPANNRIRNLKRHLGDSITLDDRTSPTARPSPASSSTASAVPTSSSTRAGR